MNQSIESRSRGIFSSSAIIFIEKIFGIGFYFMLQLLLSRKVQAEGYGAYTLFNSWMALLSVFTVYGFDSSLVKFLPRCMGDKPTWQRLVGLSFGITAILSLIVFGILAISPLSIQTLLGLDANTLIILGIGLFFFSINKITDSIIQGEKATHWAIFYNSVLRNGLRLLLCLPLLRLPDFEMRKLYVVVLLVEVATCILRLAYFLPRRAKLKKELGSAIYAISNKSFIVESGMLFGVSFISNVNQLVDKIFLGMLLGASQVGLYRASENYAVLASIFIIPFMAFWPYISELYAEGNLAGLNRIYSYITLLVGILLIPASCVMILKANALLGLFGKSFHGAEVLLGILLIGYVADALAGPAGAVLRMTKYAKVSLYVNIGLFILYFIFNLIFTKLFAAEGAAIAKTSLLVVGNVVNLILNRVLLGLWPYNRLHIVVVVGGVGLFYVLSLVDNLPLFSGFFGLVFFGVLAYAIFGIFVVLALPRRIRELATLIGIEQ